MRKNWLDLKYEISAAALLIALSVFLFPKLGMDEASTWLAVIVTSTSAIMLGAIKFYMQQQKREFDESIRLLVDRFSDGEKLAASIMYKMSQMPDLNFPYAKEVLLKASREIDKIQHGKITLSESEYYESLIEAARTHRKGAEMFSVNTFDERRFFRDPRQLLYFEENRKAIHDREATIRRIFVFHDKEKPSASRTEKLKAIKANVEAGVITSVVYLSTLTGQSDLCLDWAMFWSEDSGTRLFVDYQDVVDETRVAYGELRNAPGDIDLFKRKFERLSAMAISELELSELLHIHT